MHTTLRSLEEILDHLGHLLPAQGPIGVFIHHNTLHAFQHLTFEEAVVEGARLYDTEPFMTERAFAAAIRSGRIQPEDVDEVLAQETDAGILPDLSRRQLRRGLLLAEMPELSIRTLDWELDEGRLSTGEANARYRACLQQLGERWRPAAADEPTRAARPADAVVHPWLIRLCGAYLDQGMAYWPMPNREHGFYRCARQLLAQTGGAGMPQMPGLGLEFRRQAERGFTATEAVRDLLQQLRVPHPEWESFLLAELMALPGWAGLFQRLEAEPSLAPHITLPASLMDFVAVRLTLLRVAVPGAAREPALADASSQQKFAAARLADATAALGFQAGQVAHWKEAEFRSLAEEVFRLHPLERRRLLHLAYERRHEKLILAPLRTHRRSIVLPVRRPRPAAQVFFCIDEREESIRRQLEEVDPEVETLGAAGFFGVAINYEGIDDAHAVSLCPVVVQPQHAVRERVVPSEESWYQRRRDLVRRWAQLVRGGAVASRSLIRGWLATATLGILSLFPLIARVLSPLTYAKLRKRVNEVLVPRPETELAFTRRGGETLDGLASGFSIGEKADRVAGMLGGAGLTSGFSRIIVVLGHGSTSLNNPHESAHDCGACGGRRGGPNGRLFAAMANHPEVRTELARRGLEIPWDTWFVGGYHDTCSDDIELFDLGRVPESHLEDLARIRKSLDRARALDAHERARRFEYAWNAKTPDQALRHVEERSEHLAEPRPEYGHCTNSVCIVGRRDATRGLFFDRRAFLVSYDATKDPNDEFLARQLGAVVPVCGGISLEYYFSFVDNEGYGCGTKLPHNVTGLVGVMNGHASDLRTGLPWQMVEIHEPVRILFVVETTPARLHKVVAGNPVIREFVENRWVRVATLDPESGEVHVYRDGTFEPFEAEDGTLPAAGSSIEWYRGRMEHLPVARILSEGVAQ